MTCGHWRTDIVSKQMKAKLIGSQQLFYGCYQTKLIGFSGLLNYATVK